MPQTFRSARGRSSSMVKSNSRRRFAIDDLLKKVQLEERIYRHRCVETWSMVVPWTGFTVKSLVELAKPKAAAKYVRFESFNMPDFAAARRAAC